MLKKTNEYCSQENTNVSTEILNKNSFNSQIILDWETSDKEKNFSERH